jgi:hypothetical protein
MSTTGLACKRTFTPTDRRHRGQIDSPRRNGFALRVNPSAHLHRVGPGFETVKLTERIEKVHVTGQNPSKSERAWNMTTQFVDKVRSVSGQCSLHLVIAKTTTYKQTSIQKKSSRRNQKISLKKTTKRFVKSNFFISAVPTRFPFSSSKRSRRNKTHHSRRSRHAN